jgi:hypothetical protein
MRRRNAQTKWSKQNIRTWKQVVPSSLATKRKQKNAYKQIRSVMVGADYPERNLRTWPEELQKDWHHWEAKAFEERQGKDSERKKQEKNTKSTGDEKESHWYDHQQHNPSAISQKFWTQWVRIKHKEHIKHSRTCKP